MADIQPWQAEVIEGLLTEVSPTVRTAASRWLSEQRRALTEQAAEQVILDLYAHTFPSSQSLRHYVLARLREQYAAHV